MAHTPGPWLLHWEEGECPSCSEYSVHDHGAYVYAISVPLVGEKQPGEHVEDGQIFKTEVCEFSEADARLIAAAPKLRAVADKALSFLLTVRDMPTAAPVIAELMVVLAEANGAEGRPE